MNALLSFIEKDEENKAKLEPTPQTRQRSYSQENLAP